MGCTRSLYWFQIKHLVLDTANQLLGRNFPLKSYCIQITVFARLQLHGISFKTHKEKKKNPYMLHFSKYLLLVSCQVFWLDRLHEEKEIVLFHLDPQARKGVPLKRFGKGSLRSWLQNQKAPNMAERGFHQHLTWKHLTAHFVYLLDCLVPLS